MQAVLDFIGNTTFPIPLTALAVPVTSVTGSG